MCKESACVCSELPGLVGQLQPQKAAFLRTSGGKKKYIQSGEFSRHHYAAINTAIKTLQHNPRSSERERRKPRLTVR